MVIAVLPRKKQAKLLLRACPKCGGACYLEPVYIGGVYRYSEYICLMCARPLKDIEYGKRKARRKTASRY